MAAGEREPGGKERPPSEQVKEGLGLLWKAARQTASSVQKELDKSSLGKSLEEAGREVERAISNVGKRIGEELKGAQPKDEPRAGVGSPSGPQWQHQAGQPWQGDEAGVAAAGGDDWPKTREDYEHKYGKLPKSVDWPRSPKAYEDRFGYKPGQKPTGPTEDDPGFGIAGDPDKPQ